MKLVRDRWCHLDTFKTHNDSVMLEVFEKEILRKNIQQSNFLFYRVSILGCKKNEVEEKKELSLEDISYISIPKEDFEETKSIENNIQIGTSIHATHQKEVSKKIRFAKKKEANNTGIFF